MPSPVLIILTWKIFAKMGTAAFAPPSSGFQDKGGDLGGGAALDGFLKTGGSLPGTRAGQVRFGWLTELAKGSDHS